MVVQVNRQFARQRTSAYQERKETKWKWTNVNKKEKLIYVDESAIHNISKDGYGYSKKDSVVF